MGQNPASEILKLALDAQSRAKEIVSISREYQSAELMECREQVESEECVVKWRDEIDAWNQIANQAIGDLFGPGTVIRVPYVFRLKGPQYCVVDSISMGYVFCFVAGHRRKRPERLLITAAVEVIPYQTITDPKIRRQVEKLIAQVRLKDF